MRVLVVDDSPDFLLLVRQQLIQSMPGIEVTTYDPIRQGEPGPSFDWTRFDALLLDYVLGGTRTGLDWLREYARQPGFPPTVLLTGEGDEYVAVQAVKLGARDFLKKVDVSPRRLVAVLREATADAPTLLDGNAQVATAAPGELPESVRNIGYRVEREIGKGAMSKVYLAKRESDDLAVVLKVIDVNLIQDQEMVTRFMQEAEIISGLDSPFIVKIYEQGFTDDSGFIAMEYFSGGDLKEHVSEGIEEDEAVNYLAHIAHGLDAIHEIGIIHRDLKPANIMFRGDGSLALADFGISKRLGANTELTTVGKVLGTPHYMSPEQGQGFVTEPASDVYSAGIIFFEMLTGQRPYKADSPAALIYQHIHIDIPTLPDPFARYQGLIDRLLAKRPEDRFATGGEVLDAIMALPE